MTTRTTITTMKVKVSKRLKAFEQLGRFHALQRVPERMKDPGPIFGFVDGPVHVSAH